MRKNAIAYDQLYALLRPAVWHKAVLEVATGTGQVAKHLLCSADHIEATDEIGRASCRERVSSPV